MTRAQYNNFCRSLPATTHVVQWGNGHVWKVGGKVFAIGHWEDGEAFITFKAGEIGYEVMKDQPGLRPAPYLASRGLKWLQIHDQDAVSAEEVRGHLRHSHALVAEGLSRKARVGLGLEEVEPSLPRRTRRGQITPGGQGPKTP